MQDIRTIESNGGRGGRLFAGGGDRRFKQHHQHPQNLKCPRCDSLNTKFCYYNNYNLSQPRHFCKSCRRYWTKGGVLRNVPVGGGIRKTKRSTKPKSKSSTSSVNRKSSNSANSSSDSSSLTANTRTTNTTATTMATTSTTEATPTVLLNFNESSTQFFSIPHSSSTPITNFDPLMLSQLSSTGNTSTDIGAYAGMMTSSTDQLPHEFNTASGITTSFQMHQQNPDHVVENHNPSQSQLQWTVETTGFIDQTAEIELSGFESRRSNGGLAGTDDWQDGTDEGMFDLTGTVDQSYWNQSQWNHDTHDHHLNYLLP